MTQEVKGSFVPVEAFRQQLIDAGWTPPPEPLKPLVVRRRVILNGKGEPHIVAMAFNGHQNFAIPPMASVLVELTEGVFDEEWKR